MSLILRKNNNIIEINEGFGWCLLPPGETGLRFNSDETIVYIYEPFNILSNTSFNIVDILEYDNEPATFTPTTLREYLKSSNFFFNVSSENSINVITVNDSNYNKFISKLDDFYKYELSILIKDVVGMTVNSYKKYFTLKGDNSFEKYGFVELEEHNFISYDNINLEIDGDDINLDINLQNYTDEEFTFIINDVELKK